MRTDTRAVVTTLAKKPRSAAMARMSCKQSKRHCDGLAELILLCTSTFRSSSWIIVIIHEMSVRLVAFPQL